MSDPIASTVESVLAPAVKQAADRLASLARVSDPATVAEYEATLAHALAAVVGTIAPLAETAVSHLLGNALAAPAASVNAIPTLPTVNTAGTATVTR